MSTRKQQWDQLFMRFAADVANMSHAVRLKVGAVAVRDKRVIALGYNGMPPGKPNCCEDKLENGELVSKLDVIHAEDNLRHFADENNIDLAGCTLYITHSPCPLCAPIVLDCGFVRMVYGKHYRDKSAIGGLSEQIKVMEWN